MNAGDRVTAVCTDGKRRRARISTRKPVTYCSQSAAVKVGTKTVTGYITRIDDNTEGRPTYGFIAYTKGKNGHLLRGTDLPRTS